MDDPNQDTSGMRHAMKRLSSVLNRSASNTTTTLTRSKSKTFNSVSSLPNKDAVPQRSALRGSRCPGATERRVSFYDSLPCLDCGPAFTHEVPWSTEPAERKGGLLLPAITDDDRSADDQLHEVEVNNEQSTKSREVLQPEIRHDSSVEPVPNQQSRSMRRYRNSESLAGNLERERSCMNFTRAVIEVNARSQSRIRPLSLLADRPASRQSLRTTDQEPSHAPSSQECHAQQSSPTTQELISKAEHNDNISQAYRAHVERSLMSMQSADKRGSAYLHDALVEMHEVLAKAFAKTSTTAPSFVENDQADRLSETDDSNASNEKADDAFSFEMPYGSAQPSAEAVNSAKATHLQTVVGLQDSETCEQFDEDLRFDPALMPLPLRIRPRRPGRDSNVVQ